MDFRAEYQKWITDSYFDENTKAELKAIEGDEKEIENLETYSKYVNTKQFVELMARNKLGLVYPNEVIFKNEE